MYIVHMKRYSVAQARSNFSSLLDAAESGESIVIERRKVRFRIEAQRPGGRTAPAPSPIAYADPAVLHGDWTWAWGQDGLRFSKRRRVRR